MKSRESQAMEAFVGEERASYPAYFSRVRKRFAQEGAVPLGLLDIAEHLVDANIVLFEKNLRAFFAGTTVAGSARALSLVSLRGLGRAVLFFSLFVDVSNRLLVHRSRDILWQELLRFVPSHIPSSRRFHTAEGFGMVLADVVLALAFEQVNESRLSSSRVVALSASLARAVSDMGMQKALRRERVSVRAQQRLFLEWGMEAAQVSEEVRSGVLRALSSMRARERLSSENQASLHAAGLFHSA